MRIWTMALAAVLGLSMVACQASPKPSPKMTPAVAETIETDLAKVTSPAFAKDFDGKRVSFSCEWRGFCQTDTLREPSMVPIMVSANGVSMYTHIGINKYQYDRASALLEGQKIRVTARARKRNDTMLLYVELFYREGGVESVSTSARQ